MDKPIKREKHGEWTIAVYEYDGSAAYICNRNVKPSKQFKKAKISHTDECVSFFPINGSNYTIEEVLDILNNHISKVVW